MDLKNKIIHKKFLIASFLCFIFTLTTAQTNSGKTIFSITDYGAKGDGKTLCTEAIQGAVNICAALGGGTVYFPPGEWLSGSITIKDNVSLFLETGATLLGSTDTTDYPKHIPAIRSYTDNYVSRSLIYAEGIKNIAIRGGGTIDGQGEAFFWKEYGSRPYLIRMIDCSDILIEDVHLRNSAMWMQHYLACERLDIRGINVFNHVTYNNDGLDIDACKDVSISNCIFDSDDDALCLKSTMPQACENIRITNCLMSSHCNALKMGTESNGGFRNITISNCVILSPRYSEALYGVKEGIGGIALETVDGAMLENIVINNITIDGVTNPIFMRLGNRARPHTEGAAEPEVGIFRNVSVSNIIATGASATGCVVSGIPGHRIENITLRDIRIEFAGGGTTEDAERTIPERETAYPESNMFGTLPAYGFFFRHVKNIRLFNVQLVPKTPDARPPLIFEDAEEIYVDGEMIENSL